MRGALVALAIAGAFLPLEASGAPGDQLAEIRASDGSIGEAFGHGLDVDGDIAVVVSRWISHSSIVYLYNISDHGHPIELSTLRTGSGPQGGLLGVTPVAISGDVVVVGNEHDTVNGSGSGRAYVIDVSDPTLPVLAGYLTPTDGYGGQNFGISVGVDGDIAVVGTIYDNNVGVGVGAAYVFDISDPYAPVQKSKLVAGTPTGVHSFGQSVAVSGDLVVVGDPVDSHAGSSAGSAYVFDISDPEHPALVDKIIASDASNGGLFGWSVDLDGTLAVIGSRGTGDHGPRSGSAYLFQVSSAGPAVELSEFHAEDAAQGDEFGYSVSIDEAMVVVGAWNRDGPLPDAGGAYAFDVSDPENPVQTAVFESTTGAQNDYTGIATGVSGRIGLAGSFRHDGFGCVYLFDAGICDGDANGDGAVDVNDISYVLFRLGGTTDGDANGDGSVDVNDISYVLFRLGDACP